MDSDDQTRERLLSVARDLFSRHGYEAVSVRDIARNARVAPACVSSLFGSKPGLFVAAVPRAGLEAGEQVPLADLGVYFVAAIVHRYRTGEPEPWLQMMRYIEGAPGADAPRYVFAKRIDSSLTRRLGDNVEGRRRTRMLVAVLIGLAEALRTAGMLDGTSRTSFDEFVDAYTRMAQDLVTPPT